MKLFILYLMVKKDNKHPHPVYKAKLTFGQRASDELTSFCGSWYFIISILVVMAIWMVVNVMMMAYKWDPYPFILLNFVLSCLAALQAPIILMSQNREVERDRINAKYDYTINRQSKKGIDDIRKELVHIKKILSMKKR